MDYGVCVSHAVVRGPATAAQLYLDEVLTAVLEKNSNGQRVRKNELNLAHVIYHCLKTGEDRICMINGTTGKNYTNKYILEQAVPIARALLAKEAKGKTIMLLMRNTEKLVALYYGAIFAGVPMFLLEPLSTAYEIQHFLKFVEPTFVFSDADRLTEVREAVGRVPKAPRVVAGDELNAFTAGYGNKLDGFRVTDDSPDVTPIMLPTSGSTGLPKAAMLTHRGLLAQLPSLWSYHSRFPQPTDLAMFLSTAQWMTHTNMMTTCPVFGVPMLISPQNTVEHAIFIIDNFRPTWVLLGPGAASRVSMLAQAHQISSLKTVIITGASPCAVAMAALMVKLPKSTHLCNGYGMTETQGFSSIPDHDTPVVSVGRIFNILDYKLIDEAGKEVEDGENGELCMRGSSIFKGYVNNKKAYDECMTEDGWWRTGDIFHSDQRGELYFIERKKFWFKYLNYQISPEELEAVISTVPGVAECVVCGTDAGVAAAVVVAPGTTARKQDIHSAVNNRLSDYKRLRGGIVFVHSLPRTYSGKLHRADCTKMVQDLIKHC